MKHLLLTTIAAVVLVGCGETQSPDTPKAKKTDIGFHMAANDGNIEAVKQHLAAGARLGGASNIVAHLNAKGFLERTPLHLAAWKGRKETTEQLIAAGADLEAKDQEGLTPLYLAAQGGHKEIAELLIDNGADVNAKDMNGMTPLLYVPVDGHKEIVELLICSENLILAFGKLHL